MRLEDQYFWQSIQEAIDERYPDIGGYIVDFAEEDACEGFELRVHNGKIAIKVIGIDHPARYDKTYLTETERQYNPFSLNYIDPPGTFEGIPEDAL